MEDTSTGIRHGCRLPFKDPRYTPPSPEEVREALRLGGLSGTQAALLLGVASTEKKGSRTVRKWTGGEATIPYAAWRLLLIELGLALEEGAAAHPGE